MGEQKISINRAPVLTLWAAVVAEAQGYDRATSLALGKAVAGLNAQAKGRNLGVFGPPKARDQTGRPVKAGLGEDAWVSCCGRNVPVRRTAEGIRAVKGEDPIDPASVERYLERSFGEQLGAVRLAMEELAARAGKAALEREAYGLYEKFRPAVPAGRAGWGARGELDLGLLRSLP